MPSGIREAGSSIAAGIDELRRKRERNAQLRRAAEELAATQGGDPEFYRRKLESGVYSPEDLIKSVEEEKAQQQGEDFEQTQKGLSLASIAEQLQGPTPQGETLDQPALRDISEKLRQEPEGPQFGPTLPSPKTDFYADFERNNPGISVGSELRKVPLRQRVQAAQKLDPSFSPSTVEQVLSGGIEGESAKLYDEVLRRGGTHEEAMANVDQFRRQNALGPGKGYEGGLTQGFLQDPIQKREEAATKQDTQSRETQKRQTIAGLFPRLDPNISQAYQAGEVTLGQALEVSGIGKKLKGESFSAFNSRVKNYLEVAMSKTNPDLRSAYEADAVAAIGSPEMWMEQRGIVPPQPQIDPMGPPGQQAQPPVPMPEVTKAMEDWRKEIDKWIDGKIDSERNKSHLEMFEMFQRDAEGESQADQIESEAEAIEESNRQLEERLRQLESRIPR